MKTMTEGTFDAKEVCY